MAKVYARIISHPSGNLTFQLRQQGSTEWSDKQLGFISQPSDNAEFIDRVNADVSMLNAQGDEVIWLT